MNNLKTILFSLIFIIFQGIIFAQNCPGNIFQNGDLEMVVDGGHPSDVVDNDIDIAVGFSAIWQAVNFNSSLGDYYSETDNANSLFAPSPASGNWAGFWVSNVVESSNDFREGLFNTLNDTILPNTGVYSFSFDLACLLSNSGTGGSGQPDLGIYGIYNPAGILANSPSSSHSPSNLELFGIDQSVLLGSVHVTNCGQGYFNQTVTFDTNDPNFPINGITNILLTHNNDTIPGARRYVAVDNFCMVYDSPSEDSCVTIVNEDFVCNTDGTVTYNFDFIYNNSNTADNFYITDPNGTTIANVGGLDLNAGDNCGTVTVDIPATDSVFCFMIRMFGEEECCHTEYCVEVPECSDCLLLTDEELSCEDDGSYNYSFTIWNSTEPGHDATDLRIMPLQTGICINGFDAPAMLPFNTPLAQGESITSSINISDCGVGISAGDSIPFQMLLLDNELDLDWCCHSDTLWLTIPECSPACDCDSLEERVNAGYMNIGDNENLILVPNDLDECDEVNWYIDALLVGTSTGNEPFNISPNIGSYIICMEVSHLDEDGEIACENDFCQVITTQGCDPDPLLAMDDVNCAFLLPTIGGDFCTSDYGFSFSNSFATPDMDSPSCYSLTPQQNIWFKLEGYLNNEIEININPIGNLNNYYLAFWEWNDLDNDNLVTANELIELGNDALPGEAWSSGCKHIVNGPASIAAAGLNSNKTYFLSLDGSLNGVVTFDLCAYNQITLDYAQGAYDLTSQPRTNGSWCSLEDAGLTFNTDGEFIDMDVTAPCKSDNNQRKNIWFKFTDPGTGEIEITLSANTLRYYYMAFWEWNDMDNDGFVEFGELTEIQDIINSNGTWASGCRSIIYSQISETSLAAAGLNPNTTYFMSIEKHYSIEEDLNICVSENISMDYAIGAFNVTDSIPNDFGSWCSDAASFSTIGETSNFAGGSCDADGESRTDVWFRMDIDALSDIQLDVIRPNTSLRYYSMILWNWVDDGNQIVEQDELFEWTNACTNFINTNGSLTVTDLPAGVYFLTVDNSQLFHGRGDFSLCCNITDANNLVSEDESSAFQLNIHPNPSNGVFNLNYSLEEESEVSLQIVDLNGKLIKSILMNQRLSEGEHKTSFDARGMTNAVYLSQFTINGKTHVEKLILIH